MQLLQFNSLFFSECKIMKTESAKFVRGKIILRSYVIKYIRRCYQFFRKYIYVTVFFAYNCKYFPVHLSRFYLNKPCNWMISDHQSLSVGMATCPCSLLGSIRGIHKVQTYQYHFCPTY